MDAKVVLSVGEVNKNKNHKVGIEALAKLNDPDVYYVICGRGPLMEAHKKLARELGVENRVILTGYRTDVADFYKMADVFLFPSFREGLPVAVMEAMASGLPVICGSIRGCVDLIEKNSNGFFFEMNNDTECAKAMHEAIVMGYGFVPVNNRIKAREYSLSEIVKKYKSIYGD